MRLWKNNKAKGILLLLLTSLLLGLVGCEQKQSAAVDIVSQKKVEDARTPITVLVKYAFSINAFERIVEEKFPEIDIVQVGNYTRDMGVTEYGSRLEHDDLTDIVMTWPIDVGEEYWQDRLVDLSGMEFTNRYNLAMLNSMSQDGKLYYLPGPAQVRGIVYNKTLFKERGWEVPTDFEGFVALCETIEASGMRSLQLGLGNAEVLDTAFIGYNFGEHFNGIQDHQWMEDYNAGKGSFGDQFASALDVFQRMIDAGIFKKSDLDITYAERETMLFSRECAMIEDSVLMARMGHRLTGTTDEYALMPFFNPGEEGDWARLYMVCYIGLNKHLTEPENKAKYDLVLELMDFISTPEGQEALSADTGAMFSSLQGTSAPDIPEIKDLTAALNHGRYAVFPQLKNAQSALREGLAGMVRGDISKEELIRMVDEQNLNPIQTAESTILGSAEATFNLIETGNFVCDAMKEYSGSDLALFFDNGKDGKYNGKGISGKLYEGHVTTADISRILPDLKHGEDGVLWKISMNGHNLIETLEHSMLVDNNQGEWFYYFSGLKMTYDPTAAPGSRIIDIKMADGTELDRDRVYTIAVMDDTVPEGYFEDCEKTNITIQTILEEAVKKAGKIAPAQDGRFNLPDDSKILTQQKEIKKN